MIKIDDLVVGQCYTRDDDAEYMVLYKAKNFFVALEYSFNHNVGDVKMYDEKWLNEPWNRLGPKDEGEWNLSDYIDEFEYIDETTIKMK